MPDSVFAESLSALDTKQVGLAQGNQQKLARAEGRVSGQTRWEQAEAATERSREQPVHVGAAWCGRGFSRCSPVRGFDGQLERASVHRQRAGCCQEKAGLFPPEMSYYEVFLLNAPRFLALTLNLSLLAGGPRRPPSPGLPQALRAAHWIPVGSLSATIPGRLGVCPVLLGTRLGACVCPQGRGPFPAAAARHHAPRPARAPARSLSALPCGPAACHMLLQHSLPSSSHDRPRDRTTPPGSAPLPQHVRC